MSQKADAKESATLAELIDSARVPAFGNGRAATYSPPPLGGEGRAGALERSDRVADDKEGASLRSAPHPALPRKRGRGKDGEGIPGFLGAIAEASPFLRNLMRDEPERLDAILASDPRKRAAHIITGAREAWRDADEAALMEHLRRARSELALLVALADLGGVFSLAEVTQTLTWFADACVSAALSYLLHAEHVAGRIALPVPELPGLSAGFFILAVGKYGAGELNYSSDIDIIAFFDPTVAPLAEGTEPGAFFVKLTRRLVRILQERTEHGYVFRLDLRLRPDPGSTAVAMSTVAGLHYYEALGQNWERAALIKARAAAGDLPAGEAFLDELAPFIWRKYLDYAAIADIHSIKRQIHDHRGHGEIAIRGHNLKLGAGGIREVEFFVQTQQLIAGGRNQRLRGSGTVEMLHALADEHWIDRATARDLDEAYTFLRTVEHRLQMIADEQTHSLPEDDAGIEAVAHLAGYRSAARFEAAVLKTLETVRGRYAKLFESAPGLATETGSLVFTGDEDDPDTVATLARLGYADPSAIIATIRGWHFGRVSAMRSVTARERLTEITPALLTTFAEGGSGDAAFLAFDRFLGRLPAGVQLFSLLASNSDLLRLLASILGTAPRLADLIVGRAHVLDALIEPAFFGRLPEAEALGERLEAALAEAGSYEEMLDRARVFGQEQALLIGVRLLVGAASARQAGTAFSDLAEILVAALLPRVREEFARAHGTVPGGAVTLLGMGRLGGREMTATSDLDLILIYDHAKDATSSDGQRPLSPPQYFARLTQRLVAAISALTAEGRLYEVDFRLRPSGHSGPLATSLDAFKSYQAKDAWTWEHMALTRARPIAGDAALTAQVKRAVKAVLTRPRDRAKTVADILDMRALLAAEKGEGGAWDLKQAPGALMDLDFIAQGLQLLHSANHPKALQVETEAALRSLAAAKVLAPADADVLLPALQLLQSLNQMLRLCLDGPFRPAEAPRGLLARLATAAELPDFAALEAHLLETEREVRSVFERLIGKVKGAPSSP